MTFLLITLLILSTLLLDEVFNLMALLEIVALVLMNLAIWPISFPSLLGIPSFSAINARGNFLAGNLGLGLLAGTRCALSLNGHHCLNLAPFVTLLVLLLLTSGRIVIL